MPLSFAIIALLHTWSHAPTPSMDNTVGSVSHLWLLSLRAPRNPRLHRWKGQSDSTAGLNCVASVLATRRLNDGPAAMSRTPPPFFCRAVIVASMKERVTSDSALSGSSCAHVVVSSSGERDVCRNVPTMLPPSPSTSLWQSRPPSVPIPPHCYCVLGCAKRSLSQMVCMMGRLTSTQNRSSQKKTAHRKTGDNSCANDPVQNLCPSTFLFERLWRSTCFAKPTFEHDAWCPLRASLVKTDRSRKIQAYHFCTEPFDHLKLVSTWSQHDLHLVSTWSQPDHEKNLRGRETLKREVKNKRK